MPNDTAGVDAYKLRLWSVDVASINDISEEMLNDSNEITDGRCTIADTLFGIKEGNRNFFRLLLYSPNDNISNLKREFQSVVREELSGVKEDVGSLKNELKKVRLQSEEMWFSAPATVTETDKGIFVRSICQDISFPFTLTNTTQRRILGKFRNPPNENAPEKKLQEFFMRQCTALGSLDSTKLMVHDTHSTPLLNTRKPDFVLIPKEWPLDSLNVVAVGEIRKQSGNGFSNADVGHAISFGEKVLQIQPRRSFVYVLLTDCIDICMFKVTKANEAKGQFRFSYGRISLQTLTFNTTNNPPTGWKHLVTIMECTHDDLGWVDPSLNFGTNTVNLVRSINTGRTSVVYEGKDNDNNRVVVKIAKEPIYLSCFKTEKNGLNKLSTKNSPHLQKLLHGSENNLVTTPLCSKVNHLQKKDIGDIIKTLKMVHLYYNRVHMDLRKYNFLRDDDGHIVIIDWGYSVTKDKTGSFAGALEVMPDYILESLIKGEQITYSPRIDLICCVRTFYLMFHKPTNADIKRISFNGAFDTKSKAQKLLNFWSNHVKTNLWKNLYKQAYDLNTKN
ncbi:kinase-like domain-containing protein [Rhizophagus irregularis DAOM 181602=DAOM 197198]|nr:kinase-like domain-containing protein [Rhizophagus irregularis DAOM 181602=DAOM 197198]